MQKNIALKGGLMQVLIPIYALILCNILGKIMERYSPGISPVFAQMFALVLLIGAIKLREVLNVRTEHRRSKATKESPEVCD